MEVSRPIQNVHRRIAVLISEVEQPKAMMHRRLGEKRPQRSNSIQSRHRGRSAALFNKAEAGYLNTSRRQLNPTFSFFHTLYNNTKLYDFTILEIPTLSRITI